MAAQARTQQNKPGGGQPSPRKEGGRNKIVQVPPGQTLRALAQVPGQTQSPGQTGPAGVGPPWPTSKKMDVAEIFLVSVW